MTGYLQHIDTKTRVVSLDITNWVNRGKTEANDMMHSKKITYNENTVFQDEYGSVVYTEDLKIGERSQLYDTSMRSKTLYLYIEEIDCDDDLYTTLLASKKWLLTFLKKGLA